LENGLAASMPPIQGGKKGGHSRADNGHSIFSPDTAGAQNIGNLQ